MLFSRLHSFSLFPWKPQNFSKWVLKRKMMAKQEHIEGSSTPIHGISLLWSSEIYYWIACFSYQKILQTRFPEKLSKRDETGIKRLKDEKRKCNGKYEECGCLNASSIRQCLFRFVLWLRIGDRQREWKKVTLRIFVPNHIIFMWNAFSSGWCDGAEEATVHNMRIKI